MQLGIRRQKRTLQVVGWRWLSFVVVAAVAADVGGALAYCMMMAPWSGAFIFSFLAVYLDATSSTSLTLAFYQWVRFFSLLIKYYLLKHVWISTIFYAS